MRRRGGGGREGGRGRRKMKEAAKGGGQRRKRRVEEEFKPFIGMEFEDVEEAVSFYKVYALACGFDVRRYTTKKWRDGTLKSKLLVCNREGFPYKAVVRTDDIVGSQERKRNINRIGCKVRVRYVRE
ncbi:hypothetical protein KSS87_000954 [Heliosperma pusillum]|nr:hypothetical protein KSS87_000954 [Heliosperma pusillum]